MDMPTDGFEISHLEFIALAQRQWDQIPEEKRQAFARSEKSS